MNITLSSCYHPKTLEIYYNGKLLKSYYVTGFSNILTPAFNLTEEINIIELKSREGCEIPANYENSSDFRCLSFSVYEVSLIPLDELEKGIYFGYGWYPLEKNGRWMSEKSEIFLINEKNYGRIYLNFTSLHRPRKLFVDFDNKTYEFEIPAFSEKVISLPVYPFDENYYQLRVYPSCEIPGKEDMRCLSLFLREVKFYNYTSLKKENKDIEWEGFYPEEKWEGMSFRWFSKKAKIYVLLNQSELKLARFLAWTPPGMHRDLRIYLNGVFIGKINLNETKKEVILPIVLMKGDNEIEVVAEECNYPLGDSRCLSVAIGDFKILSFDFENLKMEGVYDLEKTKENKLFRWMSNYSKLELFAPQEAQVNLSMHFEWYYYTNRSLEFYFNKEKIKEETIDREKSVNIFMNLKQGFNIIEIITTCDIPAYKEKSSDVRCLSVSLTEFNLNFPS